MKKKRVSVIGLGYVGLPLALLARTKGYEVIGIDKDQNRVDLINKRISPFKDKEISKQLRQTPVPVTTNFSLAKNASIIVICVPTPVYENHMPNLEPIKSACENIARYLKKGQLVILESTVNPGVSEEVVLPILENSGLKVGSDFYLAHCPERINPGDKKWTVKNIPRVLGSLEKKGLAKALKFYRSIIDAEIKPMNSLKEAEAVKIVENSFRDVNIAFVNELARSFDKLGIDTVHVIEGAATKPFSFLPHYPTRGVGGHCIPVDPYYLIDYAQRHGFDHSLLKIARKINNEMPEYTVEQLVQGLKIQGVDIKESKIAVLGLSFKPDIDDDRESPSFEIIKLLKDYTSNIAIFDPFVREKSNVQSLTDAVKDSQGVVIATGHSIFKKLTPRYFQKNNVKVIIDGYNCLPKNKFMTNGLYYKGIGR